MVTSCNNKFDPPNNSLHIAMLYLFKASSEIGGILMISVPTEPSVVVSAVDDDSSRLPRMIADAVE
jgi:hypothetical protein